MNSKNLIIFIDSGDTLIDESSEIRMVNEGVVFKADFIPGAKETLFQLKAKGYPIVLVADGLEESFTRIYHQADMDQFFDARIISEKIGEEKPSEKMFCAAMNALGLHNSDLHRIVMVGNNTKRDIAGANRLGITSVLMSWSPRYNMTPETLEEIPDYIISEPSQLIELADELEELCTPRKES